MLIFYFYFHIQSCIVIDWSFYNFFVKHLHCWRLNKYWIYTSLHKHPSQTLNINNVKYFYVVSPLHFSQATIQHFMALQLLPLTKTKAYIKILNRIFTAAYMNLCKWNRIHKKLTFWRSLISHESSTYCTISIIKGVTVLLAFVRL